MTYENMDHADWVRRNAIAAKKQLRGKIKRDSHGRPVGWGAVPDELSAFQQRAMDILGIVGGGIYNAPIAWETVDWCAGRGISLIWRGGFATFDRSALTRFVFLCHIARIRGDISPASPRMLRVSLWPRTDEGSMGSRHPNLDEAVHSFLKSMPVDHRIFYRVGAERAEAA